MDLQKIEKQIVKIVKRASKIYFGKEFYEVEEKHKNIFEFENLSPWYVLKKRIRLAFYKLIYVLPAFLFGEEDDSEN